jgi:filamentous hemagglutinin
MKFRRIINGCPALHGISMHIGAPAIAGMLVLITGLEANARDILRGGATGNAGNPTAPVGGAPTPTATDAARAASRDILQRNAQTLDSMRSMQAAARAAAATGPNNLGQNPANPSLTLPDVPNGLVTGGLMPTGGAEAPSAWYGAALPVQETANGKTNVSIRQNEQQALLGWDTFNVGRDTTLTFDQSAGGANVGQWIAFNKVNDPSGNPTQILGNIKADGQVYLINRNGVIFGGSSQVNARGLTVSSLPINDNLIDRGLLNNPDAQFLFTGLNMPAGINGTPAFTPEPPPVGGKYGDVIVQAGAILESPTDSSNVGGRITLVGPNVSNSGTILTPDGQAILAAGLQVGFDGHASTDPSLRGLDVFVGSVTDPAAGLYAGSVTQNGVIESPRGAITIAGRDIRHYGALASTTSVSFNGRIDIQANYNAFSNRATATASGPLFLFRNSGSIELGDGSVIGIIPEYDSKEVTIGTELALRSRANLTGKTIHMGEDALLAAPNGLASLAAGTWISTGTASAPAWSFVQTGGQIYLDQGAVIDVAGSIAVPVPVSQNIITVDLRSAELADSPLQRLGTLRNSSVEVDIRKTGDGWIGTPLANVAGFANLIERSVAQLTVAGGSVTLSAGDSVVLSQGSLIDVSGGSTLFQGGMVRTSRLITGNRLVDIGEASPNVIYEGIFDGSFTVSNSKFGTTETFGGVIAPSGARYEEGYTQGAAGGSLSITAPSMAIDGRLSGITITGEKQLQSAPPASSLSLSFTAIDTSYPSRPVFSPRPPAITFTNAPSQTPAAPFALDSSGNPLPLSAERVSEVQLSSGLLSNDGFGILNLFNSDGDITIPENVTLAASPGGVIRMDGSNITIEGSIIAPSGSITLSAYNLPLSTLNFLNNTIGQALPVGDPNRGIFTLGSVAVVSTAGNLVNDRHNPDLSASAPFGIRGGSISISSYSALLSSGGLLDVSGGGYLSPRGQVTYGNAGSLTIAAGRDLRLPAVLGGTLSLGSTLSGYSGAAAGSLSLQAPAIQIGGTTGNPGVTLLTEDFFNQGGFSGFTLTGSGLASGTTGQFVTGLRVDASARIQPQVTSVLLDTTGGSFVLRRILLEEGVRTPATLSLAAFGAINSFNSQILGIGNVVVEAGASIQTDARGSVSFNSEVVRLDGSVTTPGGSIIVTGGARYPSNDPDLLLPTVLIGPQAHLSAAGKTVLIQNPFGLRQGSVIDGGSISISGNIVAEQGALLDVSGNAGILELPPAQASLRNTGGNSYVPVRIESNGGMITLSGARMLYSDATLSGHAGGASAIGGSVTVSSGRFDIQGAATNTAQESLIVRQSGSLVPTGFVARGPGAVLVDERGKPLPGIGNFSASTTDGGGFDSLSLNGNVSFEGDVTIAMPGSLRVAGGGVIRGSGHADLSAAYISVGQSFRTPSLATENIIRFTQTDAAGVTTPFTFAPTYGGASLGFNAGLIDIGDLSFQGIGQASFNASQGEIRGNGSLSMAGALSLSAGQIHPTTAGTFNLFVYDHVAMGLPARGSVSIAGGVPRQLPLSAGGTLGIYASLIHQGGTLRAPIGTINLGWDGSGSAPAFNPIAGASRALPVTTQLTLASGSITSSSAVDPLTGKALVIPYGISLDGTTWIDPAGNDITISGVPNQSVNLAAINLVTAEGATIDIRGGGDLYAYRWVAGNGGSKDILASSNSFAILPGYQANYSPYAPFNSNAAATNLGGQPGYVNSSLKAGDQITLAGSANLPAGTYTLLPARYALLPGALLVTPKSTVPAATVKSPDGSSLVAGYRSNNLDSSRSGATRIQGFEVAPAATFRARAEYRDLLANTTLREAPLSRGFTVPRLPMDAGRLSFTSTTSMALSGGVISLAATNGRGGLIDINSSSDILINTTGTGGTGLVLNVDTLNSFGAESLLIGGFRSFGPNGVSVTASTSSLTLDNAGTPLVGRDVILVSKESLTLSDDSAISSADEDLALDSILLGNSGTAGSGNGALVRVSANASGVVSRAGVTAPNRADLIIRPDVMLSGGSLVLDSTSATHLSESARLVARDVSLSSGQISIALDNPGALNPTDGLILGGDALASLQSSAQRLSLLSYSSIDVYGSGTVGTRNSGSLSLQAAAIRGFNTGSAPVVFESPELLLGNSAGAAAPAASAAPVGGSLVFDADLIRLGANNLRIEGYADTRLTATGAILTENRGSLDVAGDLNLITPLLTGAGASSHQINSGGILQLSRPLITKPLPFPGGLGADLTLQGSEVRIDGDINLPSGFLSLRATAGDVVLGGSAAAGINLAGSSKPFIDVIRYTSGGTLNLVADSGSARIASATTVDVSALTGGGDAGAIRVKTPQGGLIIEGNIIGSAGSKGEQGEFSLDAGSLAGGSLAALDGILNAGGFTASRDYRIRTGDVTIDGAATARSYRLAADSGSITVLSTINASGPTGGSIDLKAHGSLTLAAGASLNASGQKFDAAGKGGAITLEAGNNRNGIIDPDALLDLRNDSSIDLSVAANTSGSAALGQFSGTLHLRAPRNVANNDVAIAGIGSTITGASAILVEGVISYQLTGTGTITSTLRNTIAADATAYLGAAGSTTAGYSAMLGRLTALQPSLDLILAPGVEIYNPAGSLTLGTASSSTADDWNLSSLRYGPRSTAGVLTLRASENITLFNALSDGFSGGTSLWLAPLMAHNPLLPANMQSWSLRLTAGADLSAASFRAVRPLENLTQTTGLLQLGKNAGVATATGGANALTSSIIGNLFQVIRTGSGNIDIHTGRSLQLLNPFASIYTAGTQVADPTAVATAGDFVTPITARNVQQGNLGAIQQNYTAQYSMAGGNISISAADNIERKTRNNSGLIDDSSRQLPNNWLYRRGYVDADGSFGAIRIGTGISATSDPAASTSWWIDFSNFFQGIGALGGGNIDLAAGRDVMNIDAVIPTNARAARGTPSAAAFIELGGGDLRVTSGNDINGGVFYLERGSGTLKAGGAITTNATRSPSFGLVGNLNNPAAAQFNPLTWMPTTLFVGKSSFDLTAGGDLLLGPVSNPFLLPQGVNNKFWYKTYFSTISADSSVSALSLGGDLTYRNAISLPNQNQAVPMLRAWHETQLLLTGSASSTAWFQPWLRLNETSVAPFAPVWPLSASSVFLTSLAGDLNLAGNLTTFPSSAGQMELLATGSISALQPIGFSTISGGRTVRSWFSSTLNLSDADPLAVPAGLAPLTSVSAAPSGATLTSNTVPDFMSGLASLFTESGSVTGINAVLQTRQARHTAGGLHSGDSEPLRIYSLGGALSGLTLFSAKQSKITAAADISDIALYIQNNSAADNTVISSGGSITAFNSASPLRVAALAEGNAPVTGQSPLAGDIQISGPGTLQVLAGRNLDLGTGSNLADGTGTGITSIGNLRNPYLPAEGADVVVSAGIGPAASLPTSSLDFANFIADFVLTPEGQLLLDEIAPGTDFASLGPDDQSLLALEVFYRILRDTGRDFNDPESPGYSNYDSGFAAILSLFPASTDWAGEILTQSRDIRTRSGGNISVFAPGGGLTMADTAIGNPLTPPGIVTESGGSISIFADQSVGIGIGRIFTLKGGDVSIWSSEGDIAAGSSSRTVSAAPPTRVVIDPQSASVQTDLAGLATGGGIGVLATVEGIAPGDVDLIAPAGIIDAGDAGIRVSGNINLAAVTVVNAGNISASGTSAGAPAAGVSAPAVSTVTTASNAAASAATAAANPAEEQRNTGNISETEEAPSIYTVEVIGYGGGPGVPDEEEEEERGDENDENNEELSGTPQAAP